MSRLEIPGPDKGQLVVEELYKDLERRIESSPPGLCPVDMTRAFIEMCQTQSCGKCTPCRVGLWQLKNLLTDVMNGTATMETLDLIDTLSESIREGSDCPIGYEAGAMVHKSLRDCREDYEEHVRQGRCTCHYTQPVPCVSLCPAPSQKGFGQSLPFPALQSAPSFLFVFQPVSHVLLSFLHPFLPAFLSFCFAGLFLFSLAAAALQDGILSLHRTPAGLQTYRQDSRPNCEYNHIYLSQRQVFCRFF